MADQNIRGGRELAEFLRALPAKLEKNVMRSGLRAGANVFKVEIKQNVPVNEGLLRRSVKVKTKTKGGKITATVKIGGRLAPHAQLVEFGTKPHKITPKNAGALRFNGATVAEVDHPGAKPHPFARPAMDSKPQQAVAAVAAQIRKRLTKEGINVPAPEEV